MPGSGDTVQYAMFKNVVTWEQAIEGVRNWWTNWRMARELMTQAQITEVRLYYVPFWRLRVYVQGRVDGTIDESGESYVLVKRKVIQLEGDVTWTKVATRTGEFDITYLRSGGEGAVACSEPPDSSMPVVMQQKDALSLGLGIIEASTACEAGLDKIISKDVSVVPVDISLVFYPLWRVKYTLFGQEYPVTVSGVTCNILEGRAPGDKRLKELSHIAGIVSGISTLALVIRTFAFQNEACCPVLIIGSILIAVSLSAFHYHRYGSEIRRENDIDTYGPSLYRNPGSGIVARDFKTKVLSSRRV